MAEQTRAEKETTIKVFSFAMWSAIVTFVVMGVIFYFEIIPVDQGKMLGMGLIALAVFDVFLVKFMVKKMRANLDNV